MTHERLTPEEILAILDADPEGFLDALTGLVDDGIVPDEELDRLGAITRKLSDALVQEAAEPEPPRRGSPEYRRVIKDLSSLENMKQTVSALCGLWDDYGWRGPLDLMTEWVVQIHTHPNTQPADRDMLGVVDLGSIVLLSPDEEQVLQIAAAQSDKPEFADLPPHEAFALAVRLSEEASRLGAAWKPVFRAAFQAAHDNQGRTPHLVTREGRTAVFAALYQGPGRDDRESILRAGLTLATAAMGIRNRPEMTERFHRLKKDEVFSNAEVNPEWGDVGFRHTKP